MLAVPCLNPILLHCGVRRTGGEDAAEEEASFPRRKSTSVTDIKRQAHRRNKQKIEWGRGKRIAAVK